jgi:hypothetical protein
MNLLNFFNTFGTTAGTNGVGGSATECRGADDAFIDVDAATGQTNAMGLDAIRVALIYKSAIVTPVGQTAALNTVAFINGGDSGPRNRASILQAFQENASGEIFLVNVNHLKSKDSACDAPDAGDGQGNCTLVRVNAVNELLGWFATDPTGTGDADLLLIGDYNAYAMEDPITTLQSGGFTNLVSTFLGPDAYSYVFDGQWGYLDQALASASIVSQVSGVADYHINANEPSVLDYNDDFKSPGQIISLYAPDEFRVSDHDPVIIGISLGSPNDPPTVDAGGPYPVNEGGSVLVSATGSDPNGGLLTYDWDLDNNGSFETPGQSVTFDASALDGPGSAPIQVRITDAFACDGSSLSGANYANSGTSSFVVCLFNDGPSVHTVVARIMDKDDGYTEYTTLVTVNGAGATTTFYLDGPGNRNDPPNFFLNPTAPTSAIVKQRDSAGLRFVNGNPWKAIGSWSAASSLTNGTLTSLDDLHVWLGLKTAADAGANFDLRVEVRKNGAVVATREGYCISGLVSNPALAQEVLAGFGSFSPVTFNGTTDVLSLSVSTRIGTNGSGGFCGGKANASGLRLYFDATSRPSQFDAFLVP